MTVYVLIPVFNRLALTQEIVRCLRRQQGVALQIVVVDDGSTDGTADFLAGQPDIWTLKGDGQLWWAGAIHVALRAIQPRLAAGDFFLFMNNDTRIDDHYVAALVHASTEAGRAVAGSIVREAEPPHALLDIGPRADLWQMKIWDILRDLPDEERAAPRPVYDVDFLPGRGSLYPAEVLARIGSMRPGLLPHYHADYEFADRARRAGFRLLVTSGAVTYSTATFGNQRRFASARQRLFGKGSPENVLHKVAFFVLVGSPAQRLTAVPRMVAAEAVRFVQPLAVRVAHKLLSYRVVQLTVGRAWLLVKARWSNVARARLRSAAERRARRRMEALQVYAAAGLVEIRPGRWDAVGGASARHQPFFRSLHLPAAPAIGAGQMDLLFCAVDAAEPSLPVPAQSLLAQPGPDGVLYVVCYGAQGPALRGVDELADQLKSGIGFELLADATLDGTGHASGLSPLPPGAFAGAHPMSGGTVPVRMVAARRLR